MLESLTTASHCITTFEGRIQEDSRWDEYADAGNQIIEKLKELRALVNLDYNFNEGLPGDIINCSRLLNEQRVLCNEEVDNKLNRHLLFGGNSYDKANTRFVEEVLTSITSESDKISTLLGSRVAALH